MVRLDVERRFVFPPAVLQAVPVGRQEYRGANTRDFSGINGLDLPPGGCCANDSHCAQRLIDTMPFMLTGDPLRLRECMTYQSLLDGLPEPLPPHCGAGCHFSPHEEAIDRLARVHAAPRLPSAPRR